MPLSASPFSFRDQLAFYGAYHTNRVNVGIHMVCVPLIYMSSLALVLAAGVSLESVAASGVHVEAIVAVGGGANMQIVRQTLFDAVSVPVYVPERPELLAARGAAGIARTVGARPAPASSATPPAP